MAQKKALTFSEEKGFKIITYEKWSIWHTPDDKLLPHTFLSYIADQGPRLVINSVRTTSADSIQRIYNKPKTRKTDEKLLAASTLTAFSELSAEIIVRSYRSGALKYG